MRIKALKESFGENRTAHSPFIKTLICSLPKDTIENVLKTMTQGPEYDKVDGGFLTENVPLVVERSLREHLPNKEIRVTLYGAFSEGTIERQPEHVKRICVGAEVIGPAIAFTQYPGRQHMWVMSWDLVPKMIDTDGKLHETLRPIAGYLEIKGL